MENAIKLAIRGGWKDKRKIGIDSEILLQPLFWQALIKGLGIKEDERKYGTLAYHFYAMNFMEHIIFGKSPDDFFRDLLTKDKEI